MLSIKIPKMSPNTLETYQNLSNTPKIIFFEQKSSKFGLQNRIWKRLTASPFEIIVPQNSFLYPNSAQELARILKSTGWLIIFWAGWVSIDWKKPKDHFGTFGVLKISRTVVKWTLNLFLSLKMIRKHSKSIIFYRKLWKNHEKMWTMKDGSVDCVR